MERNWRGIALLQARERKETEERLAEYTKLRRAGRPALLDKIAAWPDSVFELHGPTMRLYEFKEAFRISNSALHENINAGNIPVLYIAGSTVIDMAALKKRAFVWRHQDVLGAEPPT